MALSSDKAVLLIVAAAGLAFLIFGCTWSYVVWILLGDSGISFVELALSDFVFAFVLQRGFLMLLASLPSSLIAVLVTLALVPMDYHS